MNVLDVFTRFDEAEAIETNDVSSPAKRKRKLKRTGRKSFTSLPVSRLWAEETTAVKVLEADLERTEKVQAVAEKRSRCDLECSAPRCNKKYRSATALEYHRIYAHAQLDLPPPLSSSSNSQATGKDLKCLSEKQNKINLPVKEATSPLKAQVGNSKVSSNLSDSSLTVKTDASNSKDMPMQNCLTSAKSVAIDEDTPHTSKTSRNSDTRSRFETEISPPSGSCRRSAAPVAVLRPLVPEVPAQRTLASISLTTHTLSVSSRDRTHEPRARASATWQLPVAEERNEAEVDASTGATQSPRSAVGSISVTRTGNTSSNDEAERKLYCNEELPPSQSPPPRPVTTPQQSPVTPLPSSSHQNPQHQQLPPSNRYPSTQPPQRFQPSPSVPSSTAAPPPLMYSYPPFLSPGGPIYGAAPPFLLAYQGYPVLPMQARLPTAAMTNPQHSSGNDPNRSILPPHP